MLKSGTSRSIFAISIVCVLAGAAASGSAEAAVDVKNYRDMPLACGVTTHATTYDYYGGNFHGKALDFPVAGGTAVLTPVPGTVHVHPNAGNSGNYVEVIDHTTGDSHRLLHLQAQDLKTSLDGKYVAKGVMVGRVGSTGLSTGDHLHYEVRDKNGNQRAVEMGGAKLTWDRPSGDRKTTFRLRSRNCRSNPGRWVLTNSLQPDVDTDNRIRFDYGTKAYIPVSGDWDGDGVDTPGVFIPETGRWVLTNSSKPGANRSDRIRFAFGSKRYLPVVGDWNGDGKDSPGVFARSDGRWVLTNSLRPDVDRSDRIRFKFGSRNYLPVAGNWNGYTGSRRDTAGLYNPSTGAWVLTNSMRPDEDRDNRVRFRFGGRDYLPVSGDWDGAPGDNPGVVNVSSGLWVLTNSLQPDIDTANRVRFKFGNRGWFTPVSGNWDGWPGDNPGVFAH